VAGEEKGDATLAARCRIAYGRAMTLSTMPPAGSSGEPMPAPSGARRILFNLSHLLGGKAGAGLMSLVYLVLAAHRLGVRDYGVLTLLNSYALLIGGVVAFSGFHGVVRFGARALAGGDRAALARVVRLMAVLELGCGGAAILIAAVGARLVGHELHWPERAIAFAPFYALAVLGTVRQTPQGVLQLAGRFDLIGLHALVQPVVRLMGALLLWFGGGGLRGFALVWLGSSVAEGVAMWALAWPVWARLAPGEPLLGRWRGFASAPAGLRRFAWVTNLDLTLREFAPNLLPLIVGWWLGPAAAGLFAIAQRATNALQQPAQLLGQASYAVLADQAARGVTGELVRTLRHSASVAFATGLASAAVLALAAQPLLRLIGGRGFEAAAVLILPIALARALALGSIAPASGLIALGRAQASATIGVVTQIGLLPMLPLLLWWGGLAGAGWQMLAQSLSAAALTLLVLRHSLRVGPGSRPDPA
jgi:O-antigen/teichoic acid export membrane protein